ncbi:MAG TPA: transcription antitermination factor NusB [Kiloniellales bacterium]|nr:transcription antitermination factor NusB [Kiloniellales bacterium]
MSEGLAARRVALRVALDVLERGRPLDDALEASADFPRLEPRDRGFCRHLLATLCRRLPEIDAALARLLAKPLPEKAAFARMALRLGAVQILFLETPAHAAVSTAVDLLPPREQGFKGLVNAVLRRLTREGRALAGDEAARTNTPAWLLQRWSAAFGDPAALAIARQHLAEPPLDLTPKRASDASAWVERLGATLLPTGTLRLPPAAGDITKLAGFAEGAWWVQDAAAALPARLLGAAPGDAVADLCAAPGGKTLQLAAAGAAVTAVDLSAKRLARLQENLKRTGLSAEVVTADVTTWQPGRQFRRVLVDAPCSSTGTLRRHPDIALHREPADLPPLAELQAKLLRAAAALVAPGGTLVYAVCSLEPEEGPLQVERLLAEHLDFARHPIGIAEIAGLGELLTADGDLRTLPCHLAEAGGMDGFYVSRLTNRPPGIDSGIK